MPVVYCKTTQDLLISFDPKAATYRLAAGRQHASRLLKRFVQVVWKPFILVLFRTQLHKLACNERQVSQWQRWWWFLLYSAVLHSRTDSLCSHVILYEWLAFYSAFLNIHQSGVLTVLAWLVPHETAAILAQVLCTPYNHAARHFVQSHIRTVYVCLAVTCHVHFWQDDWDLVCATAVTRGWSSYQIMSQHRKLTLEKKILPPLLQGFKPATFQSHHSLTTELSRSPRWYFCSLQNFPVFPNASLPEATSLPSQSKCAQDSALPWVAVFQNDHPSIGSVTHASRFKGARLGL